MLFENLKSDEGLDMLLEVMAEIETITSDEEYQAYIERARASKKTIGDNTLTKLLYKNHRETLYRVIATLNETTVDAIKEQNYTDTMKQVREILRDPEIASFFV